MSRGGLTSSFGGVEIELCDVASGVVAVHGVVGVVSISGTEERRGIHILVDETTTKRGVPSGTISLVSELT